MSKKRLKTPDLEVLEYSGIFISNPEYQILFRKNSYSGKTRSKMNWSRRDLECRSAITRTVNYIARYITSLCSGVSLLSVSYFLIFRSANSATAKFIEIICFANFAIFHTYLFQIFFESKYSKKLWVLDSKTEGSYAYIPLHASLSMTIPTS